MDNKIATSPDFAFEKENVYNNITFPETNPVNDIEVMETSSMNVSTCKHKYLYNI